MQGLCLICALLKSLFRSKKTRIPLQKLNRVLKIALKLSETKDDERNIEDMPAVELNE